MAHQQSKGCDENRNSIHQKINYSCKKNEIKYGQVY